MKQPATAPPKPLQTGVQMKIRDCLMIRLGKEEGVGKGKTRYVLLVTVRRKIKKTLILLSIEGCKRDRESLGLFLGGFLP